MMAGKRNVPINPPEKTHAPRRTWWTCRCLARGGAIFLAWGAFRGGTMALPAAIAFIMLSLLSSTMYQAFIQVEARLKGWKRDWRSASEPQHPHRNLDYNGRHGREPPPTRTLLIRAAMLFAVVAATYFAYVQLAAKPHRPHSPIIRQTLLNSMRQATRYQLHFGPYRAHGSGTEPPPLIRFAVKCGSSA